MGKYFDDLENDPEIRLMERTDKFIVYGLFTFFGIVIVHVIVQLIKWIF